MTKAILLASVGLLLSTHLDAQRLGPTQPRPKLQAGADTNDANAYYQYGLQQFDRDPGNASAAFYWAARLNPGWGEPLYAERAAQLMTQPRFMRLVLEGDRRTLASNENRRLDSLQFRALMLSPFLYRQLDRRMFVAYVRSYFTELGTAPVDLNYQIDQYLREAPDAMRAWAAYADGNFPLALVSYERALSTTRDKAAIHLDRGRIFAMRSQVDSATNEFKLSINEMRDKDKKDLVVFYNSKALAEYSIAVLLEGAENFPAAREAYGRALQEDLAYYPAHLRLGLLALGLKDTTTAMSELALASQLAPEEPYVRYTEGYVLAASGHLPEAAIALKKAIELEPYYALSHLRLAQVDEHLAKGGEAAEAYSQFLARAAAHDAQRPYAMEHLKDIQEFLAAAAAPGTVKP
jgi:Putative Zn-dependent protease, contains TPR repeats